ncbi:S4 domain-containing protein YaaA [Fodinisporobacter ferrooxydans]|uniref:S4 domain-containing protein YaaA n=1 Tax=Fodinisporobacter ferrooxydans TaxID=2901836 RepID=A0ABY4CP60_9BACL|nr:S4 domain-containing protein YaaA [Alicyclobacillaceae bacterium MYW30-H2]
MTDIKITTEEITLGQFLKYADVITSGGDIKWFLSEYEIHVNGKLENRRGKKLYPGDMIAIQNIGIFKIVH